MIISRTPFRISFCGGGSDMYDFYSRFEGCVLSSSINKYMYISIHPYFDPDKISLKYSENELVSCSDEIKHSILHCILQEAGITGVEISSTADIPSGTGLGSSSAFTVGLINAIYAYRHRCESKYKLAEHACNIEINRLGSPIGKQDQYAAAFGGLNFITFRRDGNVLVEPLVIDASVKDALQNRLVMFYTGMRHNANSILAEQKKNLSNEVQINHLKAMCGLAKAMREVLQKGDLDSFGKILDEGWHRKKELSQGISGNEIDELYACAMRNGAGGGKLLGAGGGGFLLFYCEEDRQPSLERALGLKRFDFRFESDGSTIVYMSH